MSYTGSPSRAGPGMSWDIISPPAPIGLIMRNISIITARRSWWLRNSGI